MTANIADNLLELIDKQPNTAKTEIYYRWGLITVDYDDNKFVDCAVSAAADYIVTNDKHFQVLHMKTLPSVKCLTLAEFMEHLAS
jgi:predicted nucleic acid-binding protein